MVKKIFIIGIGLVFCFSSAIAGGKYSGNSRIYDKNNKYKGYTQETNYGRVRVYDDKGNYVGYKQETNYGWKRLYNKDGQYIGKETYKNDYINKTKK